MADEDIAPITANERPSQIKNIAGQRFGRLTVVQMSPERTPHGAVKWDVKCDCGTEKSVVGLSLKRGVTTSCGCAHKEQLAARSTKHGGSRSAEYSTWCGMLNRCRNANGEDFHHYGGRGITVCDRWTDFANFMADMGPKPTPKHSIERSDVDGHYEPGNCRWATQHEQVRNLRKNIRIPGNPELLLDSARAKGMNQGTLYSRVGKLGWSREEAASTPVKKLKRVSVSVGDKVMSLHAAAKLHGILPGTVYGRVAAGWSVDAALTTPLEPRNKRGIPA